MSKLKILLAENIHSVAKQKLEEYGYIVDLISHAPSQEEYLKLLPNYDVLGIRSKSDINANIIQKNPHLVAIGAFCIGTNQIDLEIAKDTGIPVFNAPHSNTRSVAELVIAEMISLSRRLGDLNSAAHKGEWIKSAVGSKEVRGKTVGIVGYGHIGSQVSVLAEALGMKVLFYDIVKKLPIGNAHPTHSLEELLRESDFVTLHVPDLPETHRMIRAEQLRLMKTGSYLINASRGSVIVIDDLVTAIKEQHIAGCAIDVFPDEPASNKDKLVTPLQGLKNVILTPHIGGSTEEAQYAIGLEVSESLNKLITTGTTAWSVNFPQVDLHYKEKVSRIMNVHLNQPGVMSELNQFVSDAGANIQAQYLSTDQKIGYMVVDLEMDHANITASDLAKKMQSSAKSIKTRVVF